MASSCAERRIARRMQALECNDKGSCSYGAAVDPVKGLLAKNFLKRKDSSSVPSPSAQCAEA